MMRKIGVLTSGGDAPGMNAAVMSIARSAAAYGMPLIGIKHGYNGLLRKSTSIKDDLQELYLDTVLDIADQPGTYLRTARCEEFKDPKWREIAVQTLKAMEIDGLVVIGGDGSFQGAMRLCELGIPCIGIPGTIDNDLAYTEMTLGYETAVQVCTEGRLRHGFGNRGCAGSAVERGRSGVPPEQADCQGQLPLDHRAGGRLLGIHGAV